LIEFMEERKKAFKVSDIK
jgi:hypothetical protein